MARKVESPRPLVNVGGSSLYFNVSGSGGPVVVLEAGIAATSLSWALVQPELSKETTVVSYDRAGLGWSAAATTPRTPSVIAAELRQGLRTLNLLPPYLLVGHSFGGLVVQRFAAMYPKDVLGLVLVDALRAEEWCPVTPSRQLMLDRGVRLSRRGATLARAGIVRFCLRVLLKGNHVVPRLAARMSSGGSGSSVTDRLAGEIRKLPRELWPLIAQHWSDAKNFLGMAHHLECLPESAAEMLTCELEPGLPVTALVAERASLDALPAARRVIRAEGSGHWVQLDRPDLVMAEVRAMLYSGVAR